ncbi:MAG TPA: hypothetical protein VHX86_02480 [Tepidisphaeraceae bacterium]|jgi:hypothetical protein|nr:hypothetical protein [Tepidisphaeraceae bacterium]
MKTEQPKKPVIEQAQKPTAADETTRCREGLETTRQSKCACEPFEAILEAYSQNPERWDGLE